MQERLQSWATAAREKWDGIEKKQRIRLIAAIIVVVAALGVTVYFAFRPNLEYFSRLDSPLQRQQATSLLRANGIRHELRNGDTLYVDAARMDEVSVMLFQQEVLGGSDKYSFDRVIENTGMGSTAMMTTAQLRLHEEGVLQGKIERFDGVQHALVSLDLPDPGRPWQARNMTGSASVIVNTSRTLSAREGRQIASLVAGSSMYLSIEDVTVMDGNFNVLHSGDMSDATSTRLSTIQDYERAFGDMLRRNAREFFYLFEGINFISYPRFNWDEITEHIVRHYAPMGSEDGFLGREHAIREVMENVAAGAPISMEANDLLTYQTGGGGTSSSRYDEWTREWIFDTVVMTIIRNPGQFLAADSNIAATAFIIRNHFQQALIDDEVILDTDTAWRQYQSDIGEYEFLSNTDPVRHDTYQRLANNFASVYGVNSFMIEVILHHEYHDITPPPPLDIWLIVVIALLFLFIIILAYMAIRRSQPDESEDIEDLLTVEDMLVTTKREEEIEKEIEAAKLRAIEMGGDSEAKKAIEKFVDERPEAVAGLLRNWLNDDWE
jgi:flagellar M-ring protein FliF